MGERTVHVGVMATQTPAPRPVYPVVDPNPAAHVKTVVDGEIEVCAGCVNVLGYNVAWAFAVTDLHGQVLA